MPRIVQDSDDELDEDLEAELPTPQQPHATAGGVDPLGRPSKETCNVYLQPLPSQDELQSSVSLPDSEHPNKRRKTAPHLSPGRSPLGISSKGDGSITYGKCADFRHSSPPMHDASARFPPSEIAAGDGLVDLPEATWNLEGTMRNDYAQHDPSMFDEPSSTIPNATMTQQRVLEAVKAPAMLGQDSETEGPCYQPPPDPSVPWSDLMKFTPGGTNEQAESSAHDLPPGTPSGTPVLVMHKDPGLPASSLYLDRSPLKNNSDHTEREHVDIEPVIFNSNSQTMLEISPAAQQEYHTNEQAGAKTSSVRQYSQPAISSDDELTAIGLPEERYKPRPSRSRSLKVHTEEPVDYSIRPERAMKVSKRRRTTAEMRTANSVTTPEKVRQICDMGFTPSTTAGALKRNNGDVIQTVDWLVTNNIGHDELAPQSPPRPMPKERKGDELPAVDVQAVQDIMRSLNEYRRDDEVAQSAQLALSDTDEITVQPAYSNTTATTSKLELPSEAAQNMSPTKVQVVIPKKSPKAAATKADDATSVSSKKTKRRKTASDQPEAESPQTTVKASEVVTDKKRGRGRPKKTATTNETPEAVKILEQDAKSEQPSEPPQIIESKVVTERVDSDSEIVSEKPVPMEPMEPVSSESTHESNPASKPSPAAASDASEKTKSTTASPMTKSKVPYRVGLSKRARIAPLLRTLKK